MSFRAQLLLALALLALLDVVIPIPFFALFLIYVAVARPAFFPQWVGRIYGV